MQNFDFQCPTAFAFGRKAEERTAELVRQHGGSRILLVHSGGHAVRSGLIPKIEALLAEAGLPHVALDGVQANPIDEKVYEGVALSRDFKADFVLAVGGGSVIDTAKAIAAGALYDGDFWDFFEGTAIIEKALPVGVVLTIPAAGSEASGNSVITQVKTQRKVSLRTPFALRPKFAAMNPELTFSLPPYQTAAGAVDMMAHIMERYFTNTPHTEVTDALSEALLRTIIDAAPKVLAKPDDYDARAILMWAGTLAHNGLCGTGNEEDWSSHGMEHELSAFYGCTHGAGLAVVFPAWLTYMAHHKPEKPAQWARNVWGVSAAAPTNLESQALDGVSRFKAFLQKIGMPTNLKELGIDNFDLEKVNEHVHYTKGEYFGNFMSLGRSETREIYELMQ